MTAIAPNSKGLKKLPKVAVIGSGISGLTAAYYLRGKAEITLFESADKIGGHTATIDVNHHGESLAIDTGFIVFNDWTYPNFKQLLAELEVDYQPTTMGFSVSCRQSGLEYSGNSLSAFFAQKKRWLSVKHWQMLRDIVRFNRESQQLLQHGLLNDEQTLEDLLMQLGMGREFSDYYLLPMTCAIWSKSKQASLSMPARFFVEFFKNHGLLSITHRPQWHVITGGSRQYLAPLTRSFESGIRTSCPVQSVRRSDRGVEIMFFNKKDKDSKSLQKEMFDQVIFACHSDQALRLLGDPSIEEQQVLGAIKYQNNDVVLHWDKRLLPENPRCWSSWNYTIPNRHGEDTRAVLTYNMNMLQGFDLPTTYCVTLNHTEAIDEDKILGRFQYAHPQFTMDAVNAQNRWPEVNGVKRTWYCGAWWGNGFHEDGVFSAKKVVEAMTNALQASPLRAVS